jgi:hypothetical protein
MFPTLKQFGADSIYDKAVDLIKKHGFSSHTTYDPYTKEIDIWGAILLACGAKEKLLAEGFMEAEECDVPPFMRGRARFFCEYLELITDTEISEWCSTHTQIEALVLLSQASDRVAITVLRP